MFFYNQIDIVEMWSEYWNASMMIATNTVGCPRLLQSYADFCTQAEVKENYKECLKDYKNVDWTLQKTSCLISFISQQ